MMKDRTIVVILVVVMVSISAVALCLMTSDSDSKDDTESKGDSVPLGSESAYLDPEKFNRFTVTSPKKLTIDPVAYVNPNGGVGFKTSVQFPAQDVEFRYMEMDWTFSNGITPSKYYGSKFHYGEPGMSVEYEKRGDNGFWVRYDLPKHDAGSSNTHNFEDAIEFSAGTDDQSISVTYRVGYASNGILSEFVKTYEFTFPVPNESSFMQQAHFLFYGPPSTSDMNRLLYSWVQE